MLSPKPWKLEAIARLLVSVLACLCAGSLLTSLLHSHSPTGSARWKVIALATMAFGCLGVALVFLRKPWTIENLLSRAAVAVGLFYLGFVVALWAQSILGPFPTGISTGEMILGMCSFQGAALVLVTLFLRSQGTAWTEAFGLSNKMRRALLGGVIVACLFLPVGLSLQELSAKAMNRFSPGKPPEQQAVQTLRNATSWFDRLALGVVTILLAPLGEEVLFRGILYPAIKQAGFPKLAFWITTVGFAAMHLNLAVFVPLLVLAMFLTILYEKTDNLLAPITAHAVFNAIEFASLYLLGDQLGGLK